MLLKTLPIFCLALLSVFTARASIIADIKEDLSGLSQDVSQDLTLVSNVHLSFYIN